MPQKVKAQPSLAFDATLMERFWTLENDFLSAFGHTEADLRIRCNRLLLCAVLFGGLLDPETWPHWIRLVKDKLCLLPDGGRLDALQTRALIISPPGTKWFADPMTQNLLGRAVRVKKSSPVADCLTPKDSDYARIICMPAEACIEELKSWVLPAAKIKVSLFWPPLVVEHCTGALRSTSLSEIHWSQLDENEQEARQLKPVGILETIRTELPSQGTAERKYYWFQDKGFHFIRVAVQKAIEQYAASDDPTLALEREALRKALEANLNQHMRFNNEQEDATHNDLGWWVHQWFLQYCPDRPLTEGQRPRYQRARTLFDHVFTFGLSVDWSDMWWEPLVHVPPAVIEEKLHAAVRIRPEGFGAARRLYSFLGFGTLSRPPGLRAEQRAANIKSQVLSRPQFEAVLTQLHDQRGERGAHWLAAMLMFRCGLRPREIVGVEIDHITLVGDIVELKVAATPYVALKNKTSGRVLPLHALLSADELAELLKWRAGRIRDCGGKRKHARLLFATIYNPSDYGYLCDPIESAIRIACGQPIPTDGEKTSAAYIFSRCSVLRHSFVSYAVATMLFPRDDGGFQLPSGLTPDLVSLDRRERLESVLLSEGHLGLSSLEAVRQLTGHAKFQRTIGTYTHLMDLVAGAYCWRRSCEPSLPAEVLCQLAQDKHKADTLSHYARKESAAEQSAEAAAIQALHNEQEVVHLLPSRARRPRGKTFPSWMPQGNAFLSQLRSTPPAAPMARTFELPEWRRDDVTDWRTLDQIVQMASRGIPARLIADEIGVRLVHVERLACRYHRLLSLRRRATARGTGRPRHAILLEKPEASVGAFDAENACWYVPLKQLSSSQQQGIDEFWRKLQGLRQKSAQLSLMHTFLRKHQDGRIQAKNLRDEVARELRDRPPVTDIWDLDDWNCGRKAIKKTRSTSKRKVPGRRREKTIRNENTWPASAVLVYLLLLAEAASPEELPNALVTTPAESRGTDVAAKIDGHRAKKERKKREAEEEANRSLREANKARNAELRKKTAKRMRGFLDFTKEEKRPRRLINKITKGTEK